MIKLEKDLKRYVKIRITIRHFNRRRNGVITGVKLELETLRNDKIK